MSYRGARTGVEAYVDEEMRSLPEKARIFRRWTPVVVAEEGHEMVSLLKTKYESHRVLLECYVELTLDLSPAGGMEPTTAEAGLLLVGRSVVQGKVVRLLSWLLFCLDFLRSDNPGWSVPVDSEARRVSFGKGYLALRLAWPCYHNLQDPNIWIMILSSTDGKMIYPPNDAGM